jgi:hypothetical protein
MVVLQQLEPDWYLGVDTLLHLFGEIGHAGGISDTLLAIGVYSLIGSVPAITYGVLHKKYGKKDLAYGGISFAFCAGLFNCLPNDKANDFMQKKVFTRAVMVALCAGLGQYCYDSLPTSIAEEKDQTSQAQESVQNN